ncbi:unnamed protein product [Larinioides sclopetarius]|uniref:Speckle-type POZ protein n=1 Tax=Larinioides sclopetarius TaxID=280406 RepID=A0AAV2BK46_9ARAC
MACKMEGNRKSFTFTWILENFEYCWQETADELLSPTFIADTMDRTKWSLSIYPRGAESNRWVSLILRREVDSKGPATYEVYYELAFLASDGLVLTSKSEQGVFLNGDRWGYIRFEKRESIFANQSRLLFQGALTIRCRIWKRDRKVIRDGQFIARSRIDVERKAFLWRMKNFSIFDIGRGKTFKLKSTFDDKLIITLKLHLRNNQSSYSILIKFINSSQRSLFSSFKSSLIDARGNYVNCGKHKFLFSYSVQNEECKLSLSKDTLIDNKSLYLPNNILTLYCECAFSSRIMLIESEATNNGCSNSFMKNNLVSESMSATSVEKLDSEISTDLKTDFRSILQDKILCDVKLCTESEIFPAHWLILSARSPVFRAMFQDSMKEKDQIEIKGFKPDTVRRLLVYIYTDSLEKLQRKSALDLYAAAVKYQIISLKDKCVSFLKTNLNIANAYEILFFAEVYEHNELKLIAQDFIFKYHQS